MSKTKNSKPAPKNLTETELELMTILWRIKEGSVNDVIAHLPVERDLAYTSVSTILRILEQKGILKTRKEGRGHIYIPQLAKSEFESNTVKQIVETVFEGTPLALVRQLLDTVEINQKDLSEIKKMIDQMGERK